MESIVKVGRGLLPLLAGTMGQQYMSQAFGGNKAMGALGWFLAQAALNAILPKQKVNAEGSRLSDLSVQSSAYGATIPMYFGTVKLGGNMIWGRPLREEKYTTKKSEGKGGSGVTTTTTEYRYFGRFAVALGEGPSNLPSRIWTNGDLYFENGKVISTGKTTTVNLNGEMPDEGVLIAPGIRFYFGTETQLPDPYIESFEGIGEVPAHRGLAYLVFEDFALEKFGNSVPSFEFEISNYVAFEEPETQTAEMPEVEYGIPPIPNSAGWTADYDQTTGMLAMRVISTGDPLVPVADIKHQPLYIQRQTQTGLEIDLFELPYSAQACTGITTIGGNAYIGYGFVGVDMPYYICVALDPDGYHQITSLRLPDVEPIGQQLSMANGGLPVGIGGSKPHADYMSPAIYSVASSEVVVEPGGAAGLEPYNHTALTCITNAYYGTWPSITNMEPISVKLKNADGTDYEAAYYRGWTNRASLSNAQLRPIHWQANGQPAGGYILNIERSVFKKTDELGLEGVMAGYWTLATFDASGTLLSETNYDKPDVAIPYIAFVDPQRQMLVYPGAIIQFWDM